MLDGLFQPTHVLMLLFVWALLLPPYWKLLRRTGLPKVLIVLAAFFPFALILLWAIAFSPWRTQEKRAERA